MTGEEMERAIEFLLRGQANFEARQASLEAQQVRTNQQLEIMARTHTEFAQFTRSFMEAQGELNQSLRETVRALTINQARTDERVSELERQ